MPQHQVPLESTPVNPCQRRLSCGFTLIELMVTLAVAAILLSLAVPSFTDFIVNQRVRTASYDLLADLTFTRSEAIKRSGNVTITAAGSNWAAGWNVTYTDSTNTTTTLRSHPAFPGSVTETTGPTSVTFARDGRQAGTNTATFTFDDTAGKTSIPARTITVDPSGRPKTS
jgi:type IV fimbrial biogenesis protein FimT